MTTYQKRILAFWTGIFIAYIVPLLILSFKYDLFTKYVSSGRKWSFWLIIGVLFLTIRLWGDIKSYIEDMNYGWLRAGLLGIMSIAPWLLLLGSTFLITYFANDYKFIVRTVSICNAVAIPAWVAHIKFHTDYKVARGDVRVIK